MRLCPPPLRGSGYDGLLTKSCFAYNSCSVCRMCTNYDKNAATCVTCESRKPQGPAHHCRCTEAQRAVSREMHAKFRRTLAPMPGQSAAPIDLEVAGHSDNEALMQRIAKEYYVDTEVKE